MFLPQMGLIFSQMGNRADRFYVTQEAEGAESQCSRRAQGFQLSSSVMLALARENVDA